MADLLDRLIAAIDMSPRRRVVEIPGFGQLVFFTTPLTMAERDEAQLMAKKPDEVSMALLVLKCRDENGKPLFSMGRVAEMKRRLPVSVVEEIQVKAFVEVEEEVVAVSDKADLKSPAEGTRKGRRADAAAGDSGEAGEDAF